MEYFKYYYIISLCFCISYLLVIQIPTIYKYRKDLEKAGIESVNLYAFSTSFVWVFLTPFYFLLLVPVLPFNKETAKKHILEAYRKCNE